MATIKRIEDIRVWQLARELSKNIYQITRNNDFEKDFRFAAQIRAAAGSIMDNIAEGFGREGNKEYIQFLYIARGSCMEVHSQLARAYDVGYIPEEEYQRLSKETSALSVKIVNFISIIKQSEMKGAKYKESEQN